MNHKGQALVWIIVGVLVIAAVASGAYYLGKVSTKPSTPTSSPTSAFQPSPTPSLGKTGHPKLESALYQLTQSSNYPEFAKSRGLDLVDNKVRVVLELANSDFSLPRQFGSEETRYQNLLQALVWVDKLIDLTDDPNIQFIRTPFKAVPQ